MIIAPPGSDVLWPVAVVSSGSGVPAQVRMCVMCVRYRPILATSHQPSFTRHGSIASQLVTKLGHAATHVLAPGKIFTL